MLTSSFLATELDVIFIFTAVSRRKQKKHPDLLLGQYLRIFSFYILNFYLLNKNSSNSLLCYMFGFTWNVKYNVWHSTCHAIERRISCKMCPLFIDLSFSRFLIIWTLFLVLKSYFIFLFFLDNASIRCDSNLYWDSGIMHYIWNDAQSYYEL